MHIVFFFKQKTAYEMRISDWSSDVCSSDLAKVRAAKPRTKPYKVTDANRLYLLVTPSGGKLWRWNYDYDSKQKSMAFGAYPLVSLADARNKRDEAYSVRSEEHTSELQSLMRSSYAVFCLKKKNKNHNNK